MAGYYDPDGYWVSTDDTDYSSVDDPANYPRSEDNPAGYDPSASYNQPLSSLSGLFAPYKKLFEKITKGEAGATEYAAAAGILGLLIPSLNEPQTKGWKGSIDLNRQFTRTPIAQPAYTPYAQSAAPVMGRQFFTSSYGAAPTAPPAAAPAAPMPSPAPAPVSREYEDVVQEFLETAAPTAAAPTPSPAPAPVSREYEDVVREVLATAAAPVAAPASVAEFAAAPVAAQAAAPAPVAATGSSGRAAAVNSTLNSLAPTTQGIASLATPPSGPGMSVPKFDGWDEYFTPTGDYKRFTASGTPITPQRFGPEMGSISGQYISPYSLPSSVLGFSTDKSGFDLRLAADRAAAPAPSPTAAPVAAPAAYIPGSYVPKFEGWNEYFTPEGQYRRFTSTGTPITPQQYGSSMGSLAGQYISPYSVPSNILGFSPDQQGFDARLAADKAAVKAADGGLMGLARGGRAMPPRYLRGETDGMQDKIPSNIDGVQPAKLSHGEFVIPADVVSHLGNGNSDAGAKVLYKMMDRVRQARTGNKKQGKQINPEKFTPGGIAGYAGGGAVAFQEGGTAPKTTPLGTSTETNISEWAGPYVGDMLSKTAALTNTPYQAYQGPMVAGTAPLQSKVFGGLEGLSFPGQLGQSFTAQGAYQLPSMTPGGMTGQAAGPTGIASQYMNPYLSAVLTPQLDELRRQSQITQMGTAGKLAQAGAFGGSRQAIMDAETQRNLLAEQNKAIGTGYANAYDRAMGQFNVEQGQAKTLADMMAGAGQQQRGIEQEGITALQKQYETELLDPYVKLRFQKEMLQGLPVATTATTANTSTMDQLKGGMSDIQSLMKALGLA